MDFLKGDGFDSLGEGELRIEFLNLVEEFVKLGLGFFQDLPLLLDVLLAQIARGAGSFLVSCSRRDKSRLYKMLPRYFCQKLLRGGNAPAQLV